MIFEDNKYTRTYFRLVDKAQKRDTLPDGTYTEFHHIIPRSLEGDDASSNIVQFTGHEHFIAHYLLTKMVSDPEALRKMQYAFSFMIVEPKTHDRGNRYIPTGKSFQMARQAAADAMRGNKEVAAKISASRKGQMLSEEHKAKISAGGRAANKGMSEEHRQIVSNTHKGVPKSEAHKEKLRIAWIERRKRIASGEEKRSPMSEEARARIKANGYKPRTKEHCEAIAAGLRGRKASDEERAKLSAAHKKRWANMSEEDRARISERVISEETRKKLSDAHRGRVVTEETRKKLSAAKTGKKKGPDGKMR